MTAANGTPTSRVPHNPPGIGKGVGSCRRRNRHATRVIAVGYGHTVMIADDTAHIGSPRGRGGGACDIAIHHTEILNGTRVVSKQSGIHMPAIASGALKIDDFIPATIKQARKRLLSVYTNRLPALTVIVKFSAFSKIGIREFNVRHHQKMSVQILAHIVQMVFGGDQIGIFL